MAKNKKVEENNEMIFAAIKLIESLFVDGKIKKNVYKNILNEYKDHVDITKFECYNREQKRE